MFRWLSRLWKSEGPATHSSRLPTADAEMERLGRGRVPWDVAQGEEPVESSTEYIPDTVEPSEDAWAREKELYRQKQELEDSDSDLAS